MSIRIVAGGRKGIKQWNSKVMKKKVMEIKKWQNKGKKNMELHTDFYGFRTEMRGRMNNVEGKLDRLVNHFFPPPPPDAT
ncbi:hypothetical protein SLEP1_g59260 [Rubroshorea leprosula]|uniref:Uncharacterized protein n=1 Tax=Rubroshorea leprosula TaxID=152421 RepID=A0AAV5MSX0_9ROSI|nr:hypothetical protein SLEP1_g59260 [Rubroshorea leprosula]